MTFMLVQDVLTVVLLHVDQDVRRLVIMRVQPVVITIMLVMDLVDRIVHHLVMVMDVHNLVEIIV